MAEKTIPQPAPHGGTQSTTREGTRAQEQYLAPPVDIYETPDGLTLVADLPGVSRDALSVDVKDDVLTIQGRAKHALPVDPSYSEFELVNFFRQFQLSDAVDVSRITAELKHGVLTLNLPKAEAAKPKKIPVTVD
ncbi:MAG: Hsp20/alpha crystallin family protein [Chthonomonadales bacterium]